MNTLIMGVDSLTAKLAMLALFIVLFKFVTKRIKAKKLDSFLMKIHKPATFVLIVTGTIHMFTSFIYFDRLGIIPYIVGLICLLSIIGAVLTFVKRKVFGKRWIVWHRIFSLVAVITLFLHPILSK